MLVLVACEESQTVTKAFRDKGHNAFSCDIIQCSGDHPEWHIKGNALVLINGKCCFFTSDGKYHYVEKWDLIIAHPPCTYLTVTANRWYNVEKFGTAALERLDQRQKAIQFFMAFTAAECDKIAIENPVGVISSVYRKPDQYIQPCMFGDPFEKKSGLWLKNLPKLKPTNQVDPEPRQKNKIREDYADLVQQRTEERQSKNQIKDFSRNSCCNG